VTKTDCEGGWDSHRWEINQRECLLFCNQCGCEIAFELKKVQMKCNHQWEVEAVNEEANTVSLYCVQCLKETMECKVTVATA
tara:strand:- start:847 stop:1092 length:246 start_codon:yes stop_codon:yes gene_type:complete